MHGKGEIFKNKFDVFGVFVQQLLEERLKPCAVWSLVVAEHDDGDRGVLRALEGKPLQGKFMNFDHLDKFHRLSGTAR